MPGHVEIRAEGEPDRETVRGLQTAAFGDDGRVARLVDALRAAPAPLAPLSFVAAADTSYWPRHAERQPP